MGLSPFRKLRLVVLSVVICLTAWFLRAYWLPAIGWALVHDDGPAPADMALVLAGGLDGRRILFASGLVRQGYVPLVLVSGPQLIYNRYESELAIDFAVEHGCNREWFVPAPHHGLSTLDEARLLLPVLRARGVRSFLLVTSNFHTGRSRRIFRDEIQRMGYPVSMRVIAAPDQYFDPWHWWQNRESRKTTFFELSKTVATAVGQ